MKQKPGPELRFAAGRAEDGEAMSRLARRAYAMYAPLIGREPAPMTDDYAQVLRTATTVLAWRGEELAGMLVTRLERGHARHPT